MKRRTFIMQSSSILFSGLALPLVSVAEQKAKKKHEEEDDVSNNEDLMREHGVLNSILLIYDEAIRRIQANDKDAKFDLTIITKSAGLIQKFMDDSQDKLELDNLFPRFEKAGLLVDLVNNLRSHHADERSLTGRIIANANKGDMQPIPPDLAPFLRMYRPHEARED